MPKKPRAKPQRTRTPIPAVPAVVDANQRYSIEEAAAILRQSIRQTSTDLAAGKLRKIVEGRRVFVPGSELIRRAQVPLRAKS